MTESTENMIESTEIVTEGTEVVQTDTEKDGLSLFGGKIKLSIRQIGIIKVIVPLLAVIICAVVMRMMIDDALESSNNIDGKFVSYAGAASDYIDMDSDGKYTFVKAGKTEKGEWTLEGNAFTFKSSGQTLNGQFIERKYIVIKDESFLSGDVITDGQNGFEVTSKDGKVYAFRPDGTVCLIEDGASTEIWKYILDGYFISVTTEDSVVTYINCGNGITSVFYRAV